MGIHSYARWIHWNASEFIQTQGECIPKQGDYIQTQGEYIQKQGDYIQTQGEYIPMEGESEVFRV